MNALLRLLMSALLLCALAAADYAQEKKAKEDFLSQHNIKSMAVLPPVGESVPTSVRNVAADSLIEQLLKSVKDLKVTKPSESIAALEKAERLDDFTNFLNLFVKTGAINKQPLIRMNSALSVDAVLLIDVQDFEAQNGSWTRARNGHNSARVQYTLFSPSGEQLWQHLVVYTHTPQFTAKADKAEKVMADVSRRAISALIRGIQNSDPKKDVEVP